MADADDGGLEPVRKALARLRSAADEAEASLLGAHVRAELQRLTALADALEDAASALDDDTDALAAVARRRAEHGRLQRELRDALLEARRGLRLRAEDQRAALLAGGSAQADRTAVQSAVEVTEALRRTRQLMANEVARSEAALSNLHSTGGALREVLDDHASIADAVTTGSKTTSRIKRREATDRVLTILGLCFFLAVVVHIIGRRLLPRARPSSLPPPLAPRPERRSPLEHAAGGARPADEESAAGSDRDAWPGACAAEGGLASAADPALGEAAGCAVMPWEPSEQPRRLRGADADLLPGADAELYSRA
ncbi:Sec20-domain-containing protein [Pavlovales sp. CCMP2436]|nr:Sec20-domain-containing protein [Pavlovales sp. CCMP2436]